MKKFYSKKNNLDDCLFSSDSNGLKNVFPKLNMRNIGCAALDLAYVGAGRLDGYFHNNIKLWDIAAGILIVKEAGGSINDISKYDDDDINIRAANSNIYTKMIFEALNKDTYLIKRKFENIEKGLMILSDIAGNLSLEDEQFEKERRIFFISC